MKLSTVENNSVQAPALQLARLSGPHGYRFEGDTVHLNAMFALLDPFAHECSWALQLWACPAVPASVGEISGQIVAEVSLPPMGELADEIEHFDVTAVAQPPAGSGEHVMVIVLASGRRGAFDDIHDFAVYPRRQAFAQPRLSGNVGYRIDGDQVQLSVERVENSRDAANVSGTLSLELWALPAPFAGGRLEGHHLAGVEIGSVDGQNFLALQPIDLRFTPPPAGIWQIVLMLREWTAAGFVTRDFANFAVPYTVAPAFENVAEPVVERLFALVAEEAAAPVAEEAVVEFEQVFAPIPAPRAKARARASAKRVSINTADLEELAAVKGLSEKLAARVVKNRPFKKLAELERVKGLDAKLLAKLRSKLKL
jgi:DNA uptake protein ComE-like DNA-binding protein